MRRLVPAVGAVVLCAAALPASQGGAARVTPDAGSLPDLDQELPWDLQVTASRSRERPEYRLGFGSAVRNIGDGPLIISGRRARAGSHDDDRRPAH